jgi:hypothetical protein
MIDDKGCKKRSPQLSIHNKSHSWRVRRMYATLKHHVKGGYFLIETYLILNLVVMYLLQSLFLL